MYFTGKQWRSRRGRHLPDVSAASETLDLYVLLNEMVYCYYLALDMLLIRFDFRLQLVAEPHKVPNSDQCTSKLRPSSGNMVAKQTKVSAVQRKPS